MIHWLKSFTLWDFVKAHALTLKYFFKTKATINGWVARRAIFGIATGIE